jgi:galactitol-specific phosphotransferase system IIC component
MDMAMLTLKRYEVTTKADLFWVVLKVIKKADFRNRLFQKFFLQGIAIEKFSEANAFPYFIAVENLIRKTIKHMQSDENKKSYELIRLRACLKF